MHGRTLQLCAWTTSAAVCAEAYSCVHGFKDLKGSAAECTNQNCDFSKELNKTQFCGCNPYTGVNHVITGVVVLCVVSVMSFMH